MSSTVIRFNLKLDSCYTGVLNALVGISKQTQSKLGSRNTATTCDATFVLNRKNEIQKLHLLMRDRFGVDILSSELLSYHNRR